MNFLSAAKSLSRIWLCVTPQMAAHQVPPSLGFSRQEHWSGLPFPAPRHESEKWKWSRSVVSDPQRLHGLQPSRLLCPWDFPGKSTGVRCHCLLQLTILKDQNTKWYFQNAEQQPPLSSSKIDLLPQKKISYSLNQFNFCPPHCPW